MSNNDDTIGGLLTVQEVAALLKVNPRTVRRRIADRLLPCIRVGRSIRVSNKDLDRYIAANRYA